MRRQTITPRPDWQARLERIGFDYHSVGGNYWQEDGAYVFSLAQIEALETSSQTLHNMVLALTAKVIAQGDCERLGIDANLIPLIEQSFRQREPSLYGRLDLCYDGTHPPKLLEYNADTPTALFEASVAQWYWLQEQKGSGASSTADQFNSIHERLLLAWQAIRESMSTSMSAFGDIDHEPLLHLAMIADSEEDTITCRYLQDTALQAGWQTHLLDLREMGWASDAQVFVDDHGVPMQTLFKLYPWEWLCREPFAQYLPASTLRWLEPAWKLVCSSKAMLALLWQEYPNHPNLLPSYLETDRHRLQGSYVKKPFFSREGANVRIHHQGQVIQTQGDYADQPCVYQAFAPLPRFQNGQGAWVYAVIGSWIIDNGAAGIGVREDSSLITQDTSLFVPHWFI